MVAALWVDILRATMPRARLAAVQAVVGGNFTDVGKARLDLALLFGVEAADEFIAVYGKAHELSEDQPFWDLREAISGFPDPGRFWLPTYTALGSTGVSADRVRERFNAYLRRCLTATEA